MFLHCDYHVLCSRQIQNTKKVMILLPSEARGFEGQNGCQG
jgi:hypothetical protein